MDPFDSQEPEHKVRIPYFSCFVIFRNETFEFEVAKFTLYVLPFQEESPPGSPLAYPLPAESEGNEVESETKEDNNRGDKKVRGRQPKDCAFTRKLAVHLVGHIKKKTDNVWFGYRCNRLLRRKNILPSPVAQNLFGTIKDLRLNDGVMVLDQPLKYPDISYMFPNFPRETVPTSPTLLPPRRDSKISCVERFCVFCSPRAKRLKKLDRRAAEERERDSVVGELRALAGKISELQSKILGCDDWDWVQEVLDLVREMNAECEGILGKYTGERFMEHMLR